MTASRSEPIAPIYLDYNATTPVDPGVLRAMMDWLGPEYGNPSSTHAYGRRAREAVRMARQQVADLVQAPSSSRIVFTGSGSEADALAVLGTVLAGSRRHVITQATEHPAVLSACDRLRRHHGARVTVLPVDRHGRVDPEEVAATCCPDTALVSIMHANNETGVVQPIRDVARHAHAHGALVHCDAAQSIGKIDVAVDPLGVDLLTIVGHKMYAPKGIAALYLRAGVQLEAIVGGGGQEAGSRAGTENVPFIVGLGHAATLAQDELRAGASQRLAALRDLLFRQLSRRLPGRVTVTAEPVARLPNTLSVAIHGHRAADLLERVSGVAASAGSACHAGQHEPSPVLTAMGISCTRALETVRLSVGRFTTDDQVLRAAALIADGAT